jgi:hypothetical protein
MRVSILKKNLFSPCSFLASPTPIRGLRAADRGQWAVALPRTPNFQIAKQAQSTKVLDKGFFFPISTPWVHGGVSYKKLSTKAKGQRALSPALCRVSSTWEVLEGGGFSLLKRGIRPGVRPANDSYSSSNSHNFYGGVKPYKRRKRRRAQIRPPLRAVGGMFGKRKAKKVAGFRKALRLLPRKKRKVRSYKYLKSIRPRTSLWRAARFSRLKAPLAWSKNSVKLNKKTTQLGLKGGLPKLGPEVSTPSKADRRAGGVFSTHMPRLGQRGVDKKKNFRVPQARYKPGLSKAWRLLRLQFCLA